MVFSRLPIAIAPAHQETVASYLARLASLHGLQLRELWDPISVARPGGRRRDVVADRLAAVARLVTGGSCFGRPSFSSGAPSDSFMPNSRGR